MMKQIYMYLKEYKQERKYAYQTKAIIQIKDSRGDLVAEVKIVVPKTLSSEEKNIYKKN